MATIENRRRLWHDALIVACAISAGIHAALTPKHFEETARAGAGFLVATILLTFLAVTLTRRAEDAVPVRVAAVILAGLLASYGLAVTAGVPLLHPEVEPLDGLALIIKGVELAGLLSALPLLLRRERATQSFQPLQTKGTPA